MATGVPRRRKPGLTASETGRSSSESMPHLNYPGKQARQDILAVPPAELELLWRGVAKKQATPANRLYYAENSKVLSQLRHDAEIAGQVRLVYIDPPFATQTAFYSRQLDHAYEDTLSGGDFIEFLRVRLILLHELLAEDGAIYLHLDEKMVFHMKVVMDEIFGPENYRNCITRKKCNPKNYTRKTYGNVSDYILFYTKSPTYVWNRPVESWTPARADKEYSYTEPGTGRRYKKVPVHAPGTRNGATGQPWRGKLPPPGKHWQFPPSTLDEMDARGEIYWSPTGNPRRKIFLEDSRGVGVQDIWLDYRDAHNQNVRITGYPTEKNPDLLRRIIEASTNPGDLVLDCFSGSGTTLEVADSLGRKWLGVDNSLEAITTTLRRFVHELQPMGDFVSRESEPPQDRNSNAAHPLFPSFAHHEDAPRSQTRRSPVLDFLLMAETRMGKDLLPFVMNWRKDLR